MPNFIFIIAFRTFGINIDILDFFNSVSDQKKIKTT